MNKKSKKKKHKISEQELLETIDTISKKLSYKFKFGYHEAEDMKQQISIFALEGLEKYDHQRPLANFLWTHVRNRLYNYKRDNYQRPDKPCLTCPFYDPNQQSSLSECTEYTDKENCSLYKNWFSRNSNKKNLMNFSTLEDIKDCFKTTPQSTPLSAQKELFDKLDEKLTGEARLIYLKLKMGIKVKKIEMDKLVAKAREIL